MTEGASRSSGYERCIVAFFDVLGWKNHINEAGDDPNRVAVLETVVAMFGLVTQPGLIERGDDARYTNFSDNVVVSRVYDEGQVESFLAGLASVHLGVAAMGFLLRGAVTVGLLKHEPAFVFGPALNRAATLERLAEFPRIVLDPESPELARDWSGLVTSQEDHRYIETLDASRMNLEPNPDAAGAVSLLLRERQLEPLPPGFVPTREMLLAGLLQLYGARLSEPLRNRDWEKIAWYFTQLARAAGVGVRPSDLPRRLIE